MDYIYQETTEHKHQIWSEAQVIEYNPKAAFWRTVTSTF